MLGWLLKLLGRGSRQRVTSDKKKTNTFKVTTSQWVEVPQPLPKHVVIAQDEVGVKELSGSNDGVPSQRYMGGRKEPWCGHFIAWCFRKAGTPLPHDVPDVSPKKASPLAGVQFMEDMFKEKEWWFPNDGTKTRLPEPGDIVFYGSRGQSDSGRGRHVGLIEKVTKGKIETIEGNWSNAVKRNTVSLTSKRITGFGRFGGL